MTAQVAQVPFWKRLTAVHYGLMLVVIIGIFLSTAQSRNTHQVVVPTVTPTASVSTIPTLFVTPTATSSAYPRTAAR